MKRQIEVLSYMMKVWVKIIGFTQQAYCTARSTDVGDNNECHFTLNVDHTLRREKRLSVFLVCSIFIHSKSKQQFFTWKLYCLFFFFYQFKTFFQINHRKKYKKYLLVRDSFCHMTNYYNILLFLYVYLLS